MTVDLQKQIIASPSGTQIPFEVDAERRQALLEGRDEIGMTLTRDAEIRAFQERDRARSAVDLPNRAADKAGGVELRQISCRSACKASAAAGPA